MPTFPLYVPHAPGAFANGWHRVTAPGGYEWWHFDAEDPATDTQVVAVFFDGCPFHPAYLRAYERYRRSPTRVAPPVPQQYLCCYMAVYRGGRVVHEFLTQHSAAAFSAAIDRLDVRIGPNQCQAGPDGTIRLALSGPQLAAELTFRPRMMGAPIERALFPRAVADDDHHWVLPAPLCDVEGALSLPETAESIRFSGRGYHDHRYGSGPIGKGIESSMWGRILLPEAAVVIHQPTARGGAPLSATVLTFARDAAEANVERLTTTGCFRSRTLLRYPAGLALSSAIGPVTLREPRVLDDSPFCLRLQYQADLSGCASTASCEIVYPHRLRWRILGRMIGTSINGR